MITSVSVKVMRSYDYCHFEVCLGGTPGPEVQGCEHFFADELRKMAARLADKAVEQYKIAKQQANLDPEEARKKLEAILAKPDSERTPSEKAVVKSINDRSWRLARYDYQDDWERDYEEGEL